MQHSHLLCLAAALALSSLPLLAAESFENSAPGEFAELVLEEGTLSASSGSAAIVRGHASEGEQSLRILGGEKRVIELELADPVNQPSRLRFQAERWTRRAPFAFSVTALLTDGEELVYDGAGIAVGGFLTAVEAVLPQGTTALRFECSSDPEGGVLIDELSVSADRPMELVGVRATQPVVPVLRGKEINPMLGLSVETRGPLEPLALRGVEFTLAGTTNPDQIGAVELVRGGSNPTGGFGERYPAEALGDGSWRVVAEIDLEDGENWFWISTQLVEDADIDGRVDAEILRVAVGEDLVEADNADPEGSQRIGVALRQHGDSGSKAYRIPGLALSNEGTLLAVYDIRYGGPVDLPANIDVGLSRSEDGGQSWDAMQVIMDMGDDPAFSGDGVGDPAVLVDQETGRIWVAALWSHGNRAWRGSEPGLSPEETGQFMLVYSDDDGRNWSEPINITEQVKNPDWRLMLDGPGAGITLEDGTLVFPAQYRGGDGAPDDGKPYSTLIWSDDQGESWHAGTGVKIDTTEAQLVQLDDGSIMINCRDNRGGSRTVATTTDLGQTWETHPSSRSALPESVCQASLLSWPHQEGEDGSSVLLFSNPATTSGRHHMTLKASLDQGLSWPEEYHLLYDVRDGAGYSCLAPVGDDLIGILYEGPSEIYYLCVPLAELTGE